MYKDWAARYAALIKPDGILITLIFPIGALDALSVCTFTRALIEG